jgi:ATP-dependent Clp protease protease subunit
MRSELNEILMRHTGQARERIESDTERDYFMSGAEAVEYGLIDKVISRRDLAALEGPKEVR